MTEFVVDTGSGYILTLTEKLISLLQEWNTSLLKGEITLHRTPVEEVRGDVLDMLEVYSEVDSHITEHQYDISAVGYDVYNSLEFMQQWVIEYGDYGVTKVKQGARTESVPLGQLKMLARERLLIFDQELTKWTMGNSIAIQDNNGNYKLSKMRAEEKIDNTASLMDAWVAYKRNQEAFM